MDQIYILFNFHRNSVTLRPLDSSFIFLIISFHDCIEFLCRKKWVLERQSSFSKISNIGWFLFRCFNSKSYKYSHLLLESISRSEIICILIRNDGNYFLIAWTFCLVSLIPWKDHFYRFLLCLSGTFSFLFWFSI